MPPQKFLQKPRPVEAMQVTDDNLDEVAIWCEGKIMTKEARGKFPMAKYVKVRVQFPKSDRQTMAFVDDWVVYHPNMGYKVFSSKAFKSAFDPAPAEEVSTSA